MANRDVLDHLVLELLQKETLDKKQVEEIFTALDLNEIRPAWTGSARRAPSDRPPVLSPREVAGLNGHSGNGMNGSSNGHAPTTEAESSQDVAEGEHPTDSAGPGSWEPPSGETPVGR